MNNKGFIDKIKNKFEEEQVFICNSYGESISSVDKEMWDYVADELETYINKVREEASKKHLKKFVKWVIYKEPRELHTDSLQGYLKVYLQSIKEQDK